MMIEFRAVISLLSPELALMWEVGLSEMEVGHE